MTNRLKYALLAIVFILGYTSLSFELIILRQLINFVGSNTLITSIVITFILLFMTIGYYLGSTIKFKTNLVRNIMQKMVIFLTAIFIISCSYYLMEIFFNVMYLGGIQSFLWLVITYSTIFLAAPSLFMGFITSVIGRIIHRYDVNYTGRFMAVDTLGSVTGSIATTLVFMPLLSVSATIIILVILSSIALFLLSNKKQYKFCIILSVFFIIWVSAVNNEKFMTGEQTLVKDDAISRFEIVAEDIIDGDVKSYLMQINGSRSSKISKDKNLMFEYVNFINDNFINTLPKDKTHDILILGAGGFTIGIDDDKNNYTYLDVEKDLQTISEEKFLHEPLGKNKKFIVQDAYLYMINNKKTYDMIIIDVYSARQSIPLNFVTADFFRMVKKQLNTNGIMIANIITSPTFNSSFSRRIDNTLRAVFPQNLSRLPLWYNAPTTNVEYVYHHLPEDNAIYTLNKSSAVYRQ